MGFIDQPTEKEEVKEIINEVRSMRKETRTTGYIVIGLTIVNVILTVLNIFILP